MKRSVIVRSAALAATAISLSIFAGCASKPPAIGDNDGFSEVSNPADEMEMKCSDQFSDHFCGVGEGVATKAGMASDIAAANARAALALKIETSIKTSLKTGYSVDQNDEVVNATVSRTVQEANVTMSNVEVRDSKSQFNKKDGKYRVYKVVSVPKSEAFNSMKKAISSDQALMSTATSAAILQIIDNALDKPSAQGGK